MLIFPTGSTKPVCLIFSETVALIKSVNVRQHYEKKLKVFAQTFKLKSELRYCEILTKKNTFSKMNTFDMHNLKKLSYLFSLFHF